MSQTSDILPMAALAIACSSSGRPLSLFAQAELVRLGVTLKYIEIIGGNHEQVHEKTTSGKYRPV